VQKVSNSAHGERWGLFVAAAALLLILTLTLSISLLPAAPFAPTPTFPKGIDLPDQLPRIPR